MKKTEIRQLVDSLNFFFDKAHYINKKNRSLYSLNKILKYNSSKYKDNINKIQTLYSTKRSKVVIDHRKFELVACAIAAKGLKFGSFGTSYRILQLDKYNKTLKRRLMRLGEIGQASLITTSDNKIGKCAEVKAANNILKLEKELLIENLLFTKAIRPRTSEEINRCENCVHIFGNEI